MNKIIVIGILCLCFVGGLFLTGQTPEVQEEQKQYTISDRYLGAVYLGVAPSTPSRTPTEYDVDTGIKLKDGDKIYSLYESRSLAAGDIGKSFLVRVD